MAEKPKSKVKPQPKPELPLPALKNPGDIEGKRISEVIIRYVGDTTIDEARLRDRVGTKVGGLYSSERVDTDIKNLYEAGYVDDMRALAEPTGDGLRVIYEVTPRPGVGPSGFVGNTAFSDERLAKESGLRVGGKLGPGDLDAAARRLENYYRTHGYSQARVEPAFWENGKDAYFKIEEGPRTEN